MKSKFAKFNTCTLANVNKRVYLLEEVGNYLEIWDITGIKSVKYTKSNWLFRILDGGNLTNKQIEKHIKYVVSLKVPEKDFKIIDTIFMEIQACEKRKII